MTNRDDHIRTQRLVFYERDVQRIDEELDALLELSNARSALLVDRSGHMVTRRGEPLSASLESIAALVAGSFAATREMARLLGEDEFSVLSHQGARDGLQLQLVGERALLAIVFDQRTNLGLVRFYGQEAGKRLTEVLNDVGNNPGEEGLDQNFSAKADEALDRLF